MLQDRIKNGGRYNIRNSFEVLYVAPDIQTAIKETRLVDKFKLPPSIIITIDVNLKSVLDLENKSNLAELGIASKQLFSNWRYPSREESYTQKIGRLVYESKKFEAIYYPSVKVKNKYNLAIFSERLKKKSHIKIYDPDKVIKNILEG